MSLSNYQDEKVASKIKLYQLFLGLWPFIKKYPWLLFGALSFTIVHILSARLLPVTIGLAIDKGIGLQDLSYFLKAALIYSGLQFTYTSSQFLYSLFFAKLGNKSLYELRQALVTHVQGLPLNYFHKNPTGRLVNRLTYDPNNLQDIFTEGIINLIVQFIVLISIVVSMTLISWKVTAVALASVPLFIWISLGVTKRMRINQRESKHQMGAISAFATERLQGLKILQVLNVLQHTFDSFAKLSNHYRDVTLKVIQSGAALHPVLNMATAVIISSLLMVSGYFTSAESLSLGAIATLLLHAQDFIPPLREILERYQQFQNSLTSAERVFPIFSETPEAASFRNASRPNDVKVIARQGNIEFNQVTFRYSEATPLILDQINLSIQPGEKVALVGKTGAGKSTLIALLQGFYSPTSGQIKIDNCNLYDYSLEDLRKQIGVIQQDPFVFRGSLKENITVGNTLFNDEYIYKTLRQLSILPYFESRNMGLDFWIEEKGQNLSLGERQLINFVRIFLFNPPILVFDEATANMDSETEEILQVALAQLIRDRTAIIIAHRLSTLKDCDRVYLVANQSLGPIALESIQQDSTLLS